MAGDSLDLQELQARVFGGVGGVERGEGDVIGAVFW